MFFCVLNQAKIKPLFWTAEPRLRINVLVKDSDVYENTNQWTGLGTMASSIYAAFPYYSYSIMRFIVIPPKIIILDNCAIIECYLGIKPSLTMTVVGDDSPLLSFDNRGVLFASTHSLLLSRQSSASLGWYPREKLRIIVFLPPVGETSAKTAKNIRIKSIESPSLGRYSHLITRRSCGSNPFPAIEKGL